MTSRSTAPQQCPKPVANASQIEAAVVALCEINNGVATLGDTVRALVSAVEILSKQQKPLNGGGMNGEVRN
ncbi:MAG: hypothetical protein EBR82_77650 [Caulobacteraceae bacterium]|nr:hypothetical protein [Caulobacteraceae bacterium]